MSHKLSPLREYELARRQVAECPMRPRSARRCYVCKRDLRRARVRLDLSVAAYIVVALFAVVVLWAVLTLVIGAFAPSPVNIQLPTE